VTNKICLSIAAPNVSDILSFINNSSTKSADFIEIRLDHLKTLNGIEKISDEAKIPLIATNRQYKQGGKRLQKEKKRVETLLKVAHYGFSYVDIELTTPKVKTIIREIGKIGAKPIVSFHDFNKTLSADRLRKIVYKQIKVGAYVCKLVTTANKLSDNLSCLSLVSEMREKTKIICFAMGKKGRISRILSPLFGANFTYASLKEGLETASGQLSIEQLKRIYSLLDVKN
jgi:3-dehydroquinate dehydratase type I